MLRRLRELPISLAAKCQILFGAAVVLIISAALFVPWQRMEQLTEQLNEKAAAAVARTVVAEHVGQERARLAREPSQPARFLSSTTRPAVVLEGDTFLSPRLIPLSAAKVPEKLTRFEQGAMERFTQDRKLLFFARKYDNERGYRYAQALRITQDCADCHAQTTAEAELVSADDGAEHAAPAAPTTRAGLIGMVSIDIPTQISTRQLLLNRMFILTAGLIAGTLAIIIFYLVTTRLILQPVRVLQETAEKVSEGDLNIRSDINTGDEFQVLSETFNTMLVNLKSGADQLRAVNKSLDLKLGQLAESNVALYESNRLKSEFLASVSHELRTPLNSILGFAELLKDSTGPASEPKITRYIQNIVIAGHNLLDLINDLLDLAKIEAGRMEVRSQELSLKDMFESLTSVLKPLTEAKSLSIVTTIADDVPIIETDGPKLQQVLYNFLSNAIKFSPNNAQIDLAAQLDGERVRISVTDRGPGIDPEMHAVIFEKFRQLDGGVTRQHSGTGLGLAISKELTTLMGGTIGVDSVPGQGAAFYISLPLKNVAGDRDVRAKMVLS
jgi:two-component system, NarL family, sensor histidine kinase BarA